jgi:alkanesulfonate monooxygenase SsuD/methylene tetrahydromethanopterin reductase-like flavin-dependent oxidoreductase (luciferase family)
MPTASGCSISTKMRVRVCRLVVTGRQLATGVNPAFNRERFEEAHALIERAWTKEGPFRWKGSHYQHRFTSRMPRRTDTPPMSSTACDKRAAQPW